MKSNKLRGGFADEIQPREASNKWLKLWVRMAWQGKENLLSTIEKEGFLNLIEAR